MLGHLRTLIPSQRTAKSRRKSHDCPCDSIADSFSAMASQRWSILGHIPLSIALHARQVQKHCEARCALDQCSNRGTSKTENEVALPMARHSPIANLCRTVADHQRICEEGS